MLLPFYSEDLGTLRDLAATLAALSFIVFLFCAPESTLHDT